MLSGIQASGPNLMGTEDGAPAPRARSLWLAVDRYLTGLLVAPDAALDTTRAANAAANLPPIDVSPSQGKMLHLLARVCRARNILEIGTLGGYSTIWLARALPPDGRLITLESEPRHAAVARENIVRAGLAHVVDVRVGVALETLPIIESEGRGPFDMIFIDADKVSAPAYVAWALRLSRPGTLILVDNVVRWGSIVDQADQSPGVTGPRRMFELLSKEPRLSATAIQTVGSKGYDGFVLAVVNEAPAKRGDTPLA
jgi:predicted O-methyltransferase YrrM